jgi:hypothetical protein
LGHPQEIVDGCHIYSAKYHNRIFLSIISALRDLPARPSRTAWPRSDLRWSE